MQTQPTNNFKNNNGINVPKLKNLKTLNNPH
jgi:hypothetical protein